MAESLQLKAPMKNLGILLSGRGSNFEAIAQNVAAGKIPDARIAVVISNKPDAGGLEVARRMGLEAAGDSLQGQAARRARSRSRRRPAATQSRSASAWRDTCACSRPGSCSNFRGAFLNIHPSLLPAFPGLEAQEQAFAYGVKVTGCTVHFVDEELDHGAIIVQKAVPGAGYRRRAHPGRAHPGARTRCVFGGDQYRARGEV